MHFTTNQIQKLTDSHNIKFLGLTIDNTLSWEKQIEQPAAKLSSAGYSIRSLTSIMSQKSLRRINISYVHSTMSYGLIFWGNLPYSNPIFKIQKIIRIIIMNAGHTDSCHPLLKS